MSLENDQRVWHWLTLPDLILEPGGQLFPEWVVRVGGYLIEWHPTPDWPDPALPPPPSARLAPDDVSPGLRFDLEIHAIHVRRIGSAVAIEHRGRGADARVSLVGLERNPTWPQTDEALGTGMVLLDMTIEQTWPRLASDSEFLAARGRRLAYYCRLRGITDPIRLMGEDVAEALHYVDTHSMGNALWTRGLTINHVMAEAYRLLRTETS